METRLGPLTCGVDEAGRGPWAGPVVAAAVILNPTCTPAGLNDSKKLTAKRREELYAALMVTARIGVGIADVEEIDRLNIGRASLIAMERAVAALPTPPLAALVDGRIAPKLACPAHPVIRGDGISLSVAAASVIAKVTRDRIMTDLAAEHPGYGWERNKGYGAPAHREGLERHGVTQHHRRSFSPIHNMLRPEGHSELC
ncbi:MAG: ribonuclease HII [Pseudomonadota bacterium]